VRWGELAGVCADPVHARPGCPHLHHRISGASYAGSHAQPYLGAVRALRPRPHAVGAAARPKGPGLPAGARWDLVAYLPRPRRPSPLRISDRPDAVAERLITGTLWGPGADDEPRVPAAALGGGRRAP
jgi:hypothetical protein